MDGAIPDSEDRQLVLCAGLAQKGNTLRRAQLRGGTTDPGKLGQLEPLAQSVVDLQQAAIPLIYEGMQSTAGTSLVLRLRGRNSEKRNSGAERPPENKMRTPAALVAARRTEPVSKGSLA